MRTMRAAQVGRAEGPFELVERPIPEPGAGSIRIKVQACGVCHSDSLVKEGTMPGLQFPRVPGHEVMGVIDAVGAGVVGRLSDSAWASVGTEAIADTVLLAGAERFFACQTQQVTGLTFDGGYAEYVVAPASAVAAAPEAMAPVDSAPLMCAGVTTFNALRNSGARPGDVVAIHGLGGLGHLGVQYAAKMGFHTVAVARGKDKDPLARQLGASLYIDSQSQDAAAELQKLGGAKAILATVTSGEAMSAIQGGLAVNGTLMLIGAALSMQCSPLWLLSGCRSIKGWYSGTSIDSEDALAFSSRSGVRSMNEIFPLERVNEAYDRMMSGKARFRVVLSIAN